MESDLRHWVVRMGFNWLFFVYTSPSETRTTIRHIIMSSALTLGANTDDPFIQIRKSNASLRGTKKVYNCKLKFTIVYLSLRMYQPNTFVNLGYNHCNNSLQQTNSFVPQCAHAVQKQRY